MLVLAERSGFDVGLMEGQLEPLLSREHPGLVGEVGRTRVRRQRIAEDAAGSRSRLAEFDGQNPARAPLRHLRIAGGALETSLDLVEDSLVLRSPVQRDPIPVAGHALQLAERCVEWNAGLLEALHRFRQNREQLGVVRRVQATWRRDRIGLVEADVYRERGGQAAHVSILIGLGEELSKQVGPPTVDIRVQVPSSQHLAGLGERNRTAVVQHEVRIGAT